MLYRHIQFYNCMIKLFHIFQFVKFSIEFEEDTENLTIEQLSKVKTLCKAKLDPEIEKPLREKYPALFEESDHDEP